jgi:hypothetical protein
MPELVLPLVDATTPNFVGSRNQSCPVVVTDPHRTGTRNPSKNKKPLQTKFGVLHPTQKVLLEAPEGYIFESRHFPNGSLGSQYLAKPNRVTILHPTQKVLLEAPE